MKIAFTTETARINLSISADREELNLLYEAVINALRDGSSVIYMNRLELHVEEDKSPQPDHEQFQLSQPKLKPTAMYREAIVSRDDVTKEKSYIYYCTTCDKRSLLIDQGPYGPECFH